MKIAIHQPNFFPHWPFFEKMQQADLFVILIHCQYEKHNYQNRFQYEGKWYTMSVNRSMDQIRYKRYINTKRDWSKIKTRFIHLNDFNKDISETLYHCNTQIIKHIAHKLNIKTTITYDYPTELRGTDRLVDICKTYKADTYISGLGGKKYLDPKKFYKADIQIEYQDCESRPIIDMI